ncbi:MAG TPA: energy-coupling factor transporter transmembrane component T [Verrucomicrobiae bacterium]|nr:energy-coupling factor transporter transmembrane component T [Verrucomicrobiae bacterium]
MTTAWWTRLHPLTRLALFLTVCLSAALGQDFLPQLLLFGGLLLLLFACGTASSHYRLLLWAHLFGLPATLLLFIAIGCENTRALAPALSWGLIEGARYALRLESLFLANLVFISMTSTREILALFSHRWIPPAMGTLLSTAVRFLPLSLAEARRIYDVQRCRGLRLRPSSPRSWLPIVVPLFVSQMCRAHDTAVMLVVRRISTRTAAAPSRQLAFLDWTILAIAAVICLQTIR